MSREGSCTCLFQPVRSIPPKSGFIEWYPNCWLLVAMLESSVCLFLFPSIVSFEDSPRRRFGASKINGRRRLVFQWLGKGCFSNSVPGGTYLKDITWYTGWWYTYPSEKYEFVSWHDSSQYIGTKNKSTVMFQTTNQYIYIYPTIYGVFLCFPRVNYHEVLIQ